MAPILPVAAPRSLDILRQIAEALCVASAGRLFLANLAEGAAESVGMHPHVRMINPNHC